MAEYRLSPAAQSDLDDIFDYTVRVGGLEGPTGNAGTLKISRKVGRGFHRSYSRSRHEIATTFGGVIVAAWSSSMSSTFVSRTTVLR